MLQSKELSEQRRVLLGQQKEFQQQNANMRDQIYDNTFFHMLSSLGETIEAIDLYDKVGKRTTGRDCFRVFFDRLGRSYNKNKKEKNGPLKTFDKLNEEFFAQVGHEFGHYFRFLYNFFRFLDQNESTQVYHRKILRAFLSDYELALIFYNCRTKDGTNFKQYIEKYELFDNLPMGLLLDKDHVNFYNAEAYGKNRHYKSEAP